MTGKAAPAKDGGGTKGVYRDRAGWRARIYFNGKQHHLGRYPTERMALQCVDCAGMLLFGERACVNFGVESAVNCMHLFSFDHVLRLVQDGKRGPLLPQGPGAEGDGEAAGPGAADGLKRGPAGPPIGVQRPLKRPSGAVVARGAPSSSSGGDDDDDDDDDGDDGDGSESVGDGSEGVSGPRTLLLPTCPEKRDERGGNAFTTVKEGGFLPRPSQPQLPAPPAAVAERQPPGPPGRTQRRASRLGGGGAVGGGGGVTNGPEQGAERQHSAARLPPCALQVGGVVTTGAFVMTCRDEWERAASLDSMMSSRDVIRQLSAQLPCRAASGGENSGGSESNGCSSDGAPSGGKPPVDQPRVGPQWGRPRAAASSAAACCDGPFRHQPVPQPLEPRRQPQLQLRAQAQAWGYPQPQVAKQQKQQQQKQQQQQAPLQPPPEKPRRHVQQQTPQPQAQPQAQPLAQPQPPQPLASSTQQGASRATGAAAAGGDSESVAARRCPGPRGGAAGGCGAAQQGGTLRATLSQRTSITLTLSGAFEGVGGSLDKKTEGSFSQEYSLDAVSALWLSWVTEDT